MVEFKPDPKNARRHTSRNRAVIRQSIIEVGAGRSILVDGDGIVRAGNGVYEEAKALGLKIRPIEAAPDELIAVVRLDLHGAQAERAALFDNRAGELSEWDTKVLAMLQQQQPDVIEGIFDDGDLHAMLEEAEDLAEVEGELNREPADKEDLKNGLGDTKAKIKPVIYAADLALFEEAIRATGEENRGKALLMICRSYLEYHEEELAE